jgi:hypothetical protein
LLPKSALLTRHSFLAILIAFSGAAGDALAESAIAHEYDVIVYGGTAAGVIAAVQVARMGKRCLLIEPTHHVGGMSSSGLGMTDTGNRQVIGGLSREFYQRVRRHYDRNDAWQFQAEADFAFFREGDDAAWRFEPKVAEQTFVALLAETDVAVLKGERIDLGSDQNGRRGVKLRDRKIVAVRTESGRTFTGQRFIDATYEGDLMALAGVSYRIGREANAEYGETLNGVQLANATYHQFASQVDPYVVPGEPDSGLLPGVSGTAPKGDGSADERVQAYCFRMCLTDEPANRVPFAKPADYDPLRYELLARYLAAGTDDRYLHPAAMPNKKTDTNNNGAFSTDNIGMNAGYPDGDYAVRERIVRDHRSYQRGLMWFLSHDERVPAKLRDYVGSLGLAKDEFEDNDHWPYQLYVREARRMLSDYVQTEADCRRTKETPQSIGMGSYNMDSHHVQRFVDEDGFARNEGDVQVSPGGPYQISYRAIRPRREECTNLLVPVAVSASHIAYGSIRMEPVFMILGQSAATAACQSIDADCDVQEIDFLSLRRRLLQDGQVLSAP